jgi:hypothetical protein
MHPTCMAIFGRVNRVDRAHKYIFTFCRHLKCIWSSTTLQSSLSSSLPTGRSPVCCNNGRLFEFARRDGAGSFCAHLCELIQGCLSNGHAPSLYIQTIATSVAMRVTDAKLFPWSVIDLRLSSHQIHSTKDNSSSFA